MAITGHDHQLRKKPRETGGQGLKMDKAGGCGRRGGARPGRRPRPVLGRWEGGAVGSPRAKGRGSAPDASIAQSWTQSSSCSFRLPTWEKMTASQSQGPSVGYSRQSHYLV